MFKRVLIAALLFALAGCGSLIVVQQTAHSLHSRRGFEWATHECAGFIVHAECQSGSAADIETIVDAMAAARQRIADYFGGQPYAPTVTLFAVDTRERMHALIGRRTNATCYYASNTICVVWPRSGSFGVTHELAHVVAMNLWGVPDRSINEGVAVDATGPWAGHDVHAVCQVLRARGELPSLDDLTRRFESFPTAVSYPAIGSFTRFVRSTYGGDAVRAIWEKGWDELPEFTGQSLHQLEAMWLSVVDDADAGGVHYDPVKVTPVDDR